MSLVSRFTNRTKPILPAQGTQSIFYTVDGFSGEVNSKTALKHTTVYTCNQAIADPLAAVTLSIMERDRYDKKKAYTHPLFQLLRNSPNPYNTSFEWRQMIVTDVNMRGNHYSQIVRNGLGQIVGLYPLIADNMEVKLRTNGKLAYIYKTTEGKQVALKQEEVLHIKGLPDQSGLVGLNPIEYNRNAIKLSRTTEQFGINFFENGANGSGVLEHPQTLSEEAYERLRSSFEEKYQGLTNSGKPIILEEGLKYTRLSLSNEDSQFLDTRKFQKSEIAALFKVPPYMLGDMEKSTFNNMEQMATNFVMNTLMPWAVKIEQAMWKALLTEDEKERYFFRFNLNTLMRGDFKTRTEGYRTMINSGIMTPNEARALEDMNSMGVKGDNHYMQMNMATLEEINKGKVNEQN